MPNREKCVSFIFLYCQFILFIIVYLDLLSLFLLIVLCFKQCSFSRIFTDPLWLATSTCLRGNGKNDLRWKWYMYEDRLNWLFWCVVNWLTRRSGMTHETVAIFKVTKPWIWDARTVTLFLYKVDHATVWIKTKLLFPDSFWYKFLCRGPSGLRGITNPISWANFFPNPTSRPIPTSRIKKKSHNISSFLRGGS